MQRLLPRAADASLLAGAALLFLAAAGFAQPADQQDDEASSLTPAQGVADRLFEIINNADPKPPESTSTYVRGSTGEAVIAKVVAEIGDQRLLKLPTGEYDLVARRDTRTCNKPFKSATRSELAKKLRADGYEDFKIVPSGYFLFCYDCSEAYYQHTRSILESMLSGVVEQLRDWGLKPKRPETPLVVMIVGSREAFDAIQKMPAGVAAYYSQINNRVVLYEDQRLWEAAPEYAFKEAAYTVAHEGIHQLLANTGIQRRLSRWPQWISEGLPEYFCPLRVNTKLITKDKAELPERTLTWRRAGEVNDLRMRHLLRSRARGGDLIEESVSARSLTAYGYAVSWGLVHYLATRKPDEFAAYLQEVAKSEPLTKREYRGPDPLFVKHFGEEYPLLEKKIQRHLLDKKVQKRYRDPVVHQTHYVMKQVIKRGRTFTTTVALTLSPAEAREWRDKRLALAEAEGKKSAFYTIVCKTRKEANYHLGKLGFRVRE